MISERTHMFTHPCQHACMQLHIHTHVRTHIQTHAQTPRTCLFTTNTDMYTQENTYETEFAPVDTYVQYARRGNGIRLHNRPITECTPQNMGCRFRHIRLSGHKCPCKQSLALAFTGSSLPSASSSPAFLFRNTYRLGRMRSGRGSSTFLLSSRLSTSQLS